MSNYVICNSVYEKIGNVERFVRFCESDFGGKVLEKEAEYIYEELKGCQRILDVGCGIGFFEQRLQDLNVIGLDSSEEMLAEAKKQSNKTFVLGDAENLVFDESSFDAVFYVATLEFVDDYQRTIREAWRVTKPGGKILVMSLNPESKYFKEHIQNEGSYFRRIKHINLKEISDYISKFYILTKEEYFLGIRGQEIFDTSDKRFASLYVILAKKKP